MESLPAGIAGWWRIVDTGAWGDRKICGSRSEGPSAQRDRAAAGGALLQRGDVAGDLGGSLHELLPLLYGRRRRRPALAARRPVLEQRGPALAEVLRLLVRADEPGPLEDLDLRLRLAYLDLAADELPRGGVAKAVHRDVALHVHDAVVEEVDVGDPDRQGHEMWLLDGEELARRGVEVAAVGGVDLVAPGEGLGVQVVP